MQFDPHMEKFGEMTPAERRQMKRAWKEQISNQYVGRGFIPGPFWSRTNDPDAEPRRKGPRGSDWENW